MKKTILLVLLVLMVSVALVAAAPGFEKLARLTIWNRTGSTIYIKLTTPKDNGNLHYYLTIKTGLHVYTVQRELYDITYWSCGETTTGVVDIFTQLSLTFTNCAYLHDTGTTRWAYQNATLSGLQVEGRQFHNMGEPSMEKVHSKLSFWKWDWDSVRGCVIQVPTDGSVTTYYDQNGTAYAAYDNVNNGSESVNGITYMGFTKQYTTNNRVACGGTYYMDAAKTKVATVMYRNNIRVVDNTYYKTSLTKTGTYVDAILRWKRASFMSPADVGGYWYPWYLSYGRLSARDIHWMVRDSRSSQSVGAKP
jgi:hypothetical protein